MSATNGKTKKNFNEVSQASDKSLSIKAPYLSDFEAQGGNTVDY